MKLPFLSAAVAVCFLSTMARAADDYHIAASDQAVPEEVGADVAKQLSPKGVKVTSGKRTLCEIWLRGVVPTQQGFAPSQTVLYPLSVGELVGVIRFPRKATDFRNQDIKAGVYTLRYGLQPVDGNHVGTSETRDFLLLSPAADDTNPEKIPEEELFKFSRDASATTHPAIFPLQAAPTDDAAEVPAVVHDEARELWGVLLKATCATGGTKAEKLIQFVVAGHAAE